MSVLAEHESTRPISEADVRKKYENAEKLRKRIGFIKEEATEAKAKICIAKMQRT